MTDSLICEPCPYPRDAPTELEHCACGADFRSDGTRCYACEKLLCAACPQRQCDECQDWHCSGCLFTVTRLGKSARMCQSCIEREREENDE